MEILNLDSVMMPKYCELEKVRKQAINFLDYWRKAKQREPERLMVDVKYHGLWLKAIKSNEDLSRRFGTNPEFRLLDLPVEFV